MPWQWLRHLPMAMLEMLIDGNGSDEHICVARASWTWQGCAYHGFLISTYCCTLSYMVWYAIVQYGMGRCGVCPHIPSPGITWFGAIW